MGIQELIYLKTSNFYESLAPKEFKNALISFLAKTKITEVLRMTNEQSKRRCTNCAFSLKTAMKSSFKSSSCKWLLGDRLEFGCCVSNMHFRG